MLTSNHQLERRFQNMGVGDGNSWRATDMGLCGCSLHGGNQGGAEADMAVDCPHSPGKCRPRWRVTWFLFAYPAGGLWWALKAHLPGWLSETEMQLQYSHLPPALLQNPPDSINLTCFN